MRGGSNDLMTIALESDGYREKFVCTVSFFLYA
jgi:hypothetical protein